MYFKFEDDFITPNVRCIPMIVRFKLDACGIKLKLEEWSRMTREERDKLVTADCSTPKARTRFRHRLQQLVFERTGNTATEIPVEDDPEWSRTDIIPATIVSKLAEGSWSVSLQQWKQLDDLQRFVLFKLSRPGHENKNFPKALAEFRLSE